MVARRSPRLDPPSDLGGHPVRLIGPRRERNLADGRGPGEAAMRHQPLHDPALHLQPIRVVEPDEPVRRIEDRCPRPVVPPHDHGSGVPEALQEVDDRASGRAPEPIDRLVVVADHGDVSVGLRDQRDKLGLGAIDILELIHEHIAKPALETTTGGGVLAQERERKPHLVAEVDRSRLGQQLLVAPIGGGELHVATSLLAKRGAARRVVRRPGCEHEGCCVGRVALRGDVFVLETAEERGQGGQEPRRVTQRSIGVQLEPEQALAHEDHRLGA